MHPLVFDYLTKDKDYVKGRIFDVSKLDADRACVVLDTKQEIHLYVATEKYETLKNRVLEEATFIGKYKLGILECDCVIFGKRETKELV